MPEAASHFAVSLELEPTLRISDDRMRAVLRLPAAMGREWRSVDRLMNLLTEAGVLVGEDTARLVRAILARFEEEPTDTEQIVAEGVPPQRGTDGAIRWQPGFQPTRHRKVVPAHDAPDVPDDPDDATGAAPGDAPAAASDAPTGDEAVDFYEQSPFVTVSAAQHIATLIPPGIGRPGFDVFGQRVAAPAGREYPIEHDASIQRTAGGKLLAARAGLLDGTRYRLEVRPVLNIGEHVDFSTGHVRFQGTVQVGGNVRDRFRIEAQQDVAVEGLIEAAHIQCGGTLRALGGMAGRELGTLDVGGDLIARHLGGVSGRVAGDARIEREIMQSRLTIVGRLRLRGGDIIGGHVTVGDAVEIDTLGSDAGVPTTLQLGFVPDLSESLNRLSGMLPTLDAKIQDVQQRVEHMAANQGRFGRTRLDQARRMLEHLKARRATLCERIEDLSAQFDRRCIVDLSVFGTIHPKVTLMLPRCRLMFHETLPGPLYLRRDQTGRYHLHRGSGHDMPFKDIAEVQSTLNW